jgi:hypothetical protein
VKNLAIWIAIFVFAAGVLERLNLPLPILLLGLFLLSAHAWGWFEWPWERKGGGK